MAREKNKSKNFEESLVNRFFFFAKRLIIVYNIERIISRRVESSSLFVPRQSESEILWTEEGGIIVLSPRGGIRIDDIGSPMSSAAFRSF